MKKSIIHGIFAIFPVILIVFVISCTKEGPQGMPGLDAEVICGTCHNVNSDILAKQSQFQTSLHASGSTSERNSNNCAVCHTSQGFVERIATGADTTLATIDNPVHINCRTCHNIHLDYAASDYDLVTSSPVSFWLNGETFDFGNANICANCHQSRVPSDMPVVSGPNVEITSTRFGPHHGPQGAMFAGTGGFEIPGALSYNSSQHTNLVSDGCVKCHMPNPYGTQAGGHTFNMTYVYHGHDAIWQEGCGDCHTDASALSTKIDDTADDIDMLLASLRSKLITEGVLDSSDYAVKGTYSALLAGAVWNYKFVLEDRSNGAHNFNYAKALLSNTIDALP